MRTDDYFVLPPIMFNCWKHHAKFISSKISQAGINDEQSFRIFLNDLLKIGDSLMDFYFGELLPRQISTQIIDRLNSLNVLKAAEYKSWIAKSQSEYRLIGISDNSNWALRIGNSEERFAHIHPARHSPHTIRVRAKTLKTAVAVTAWTAKFGEDQFDISLINFIRRNFLLESPIKQINTSEGLGRLLNLLKNF